MQLKRYTCNVCGASVAAVNSLRDASVAGTVARTDTRGRAPFEPRICNGCARAAFQIMDYSRAARGNV